MNSKNTWVGCRTTCEATWIFLVENGTCERANHPSLRRVVLQAHTSLNDRFSFGCHDFALVHGCLGHYICNDQLSANKVSTMFTGLLTCLVGVRNARFFLGRPCVWRTQEVLHWNYSLHVVVGFLLWRCLKSRKMFHTPVAQGRILNVCIRYTC